METKAIINKDRNYLGRFQKGHPDFAKNKGRKRTKWAKRKMREAKLKNPVRYWLGKKRPPFSRGWKKKQSEGIKKHYDRVGRKGENRKRTDERYDSLYQWWHDEIKKRDKNTCRISNKDCSGYCIVHHILPWRDFPELRYNINNGITLCQAHHPRKRAEEKRLIPVLQDLVSVTNERF